MSFAVSVVSSVPTITQSGTDTSWAGIDSMISGLASVVALTAYAVNDVRKPPAANGMWFRCTTAGTTAAIPPLYGASPGSTTTDGTAVFTAFRAPFSVAPNDTKQYFCSDCRVSITGTLTITDPSKETIVCLTLETTSSAIYTSGIFAADGVTPKYSGVHFTTLKKGGNNYAELETWNGVWAIRGGSIILSGSVRPDGSGSQIFTGVSLISGAQWGTSSIRWRQYNTALRMQNCRTYAFGIDCFNIPLEVDIKGFASEYVAQYVGSQYGGIDALLSMSALSNTDGVYDFDNYSGGWVEIYNCVKGAALNVVCQQNIARHCVPLFQTLNFTVANLSGVVQDGVKYTCIDAPVSNSPTVTITTQGSLKTWDFRNPITYAGATAGGGLATSTPVLKVWHGASNLQNLRFPSSTATYRFCGYKLRQLDKAIVLGSDTAQAIGIAGEGATNCTLSEAAAAALTGIALAPSGATGGTATITVAHDVLELWQYFRAWKPLNLTSDDTWLPATPALSLGAWNLTCGSTVISAAGLFNQLSTSGIISANLTAGGAYTYVSGSLVLPLSAPTVTAGTMNIGAAGTYTFSTVGTTVSMTPTSASSYVFTGTHGGTLSLKNTSAFAITVQVPLGTTYTTASNTGGAITVTNPATTLQFLRPNIINGSNYVLRNNTTSTEVASGTTSGGTGINVTLTQGTHYSPADVLEMRIGYCVGTSARLPITEQATAPSGSAVNSSPTSQVNHDFYISIGIDGSTRTEFSADYPNNNVKVVVAADFYGQNFMAWWVFNEATLNGLRNFIGRYTLIDEGNIRNNTSAGIVLFDNATATNIKQIDNARIFRSDGGYPVKNPSSGGGSIDINWRNAVQTIAVGSAVLPADITAIAAAVWNSTVASYPTTGTFGLSSAQTRTLAGLIPAAL